MWFKNIYIYRFTKPFELSAEQLEQALDEKPFVPCGNQERSQLGWSAPLALDNAPLVHVCGNFWMISLKKQERLLPASVVNEQVTIKAEALEAEQHRKVSRKEKTELKELVTQELLPRSFTRTVNHYAYLCPTKGYLVINTSSAKLADEYTSFLRQTIGSLPVRVPALKQSPNVLMSRWLTLEAAPGLGFEVQSETELVSRGEEKGSIKYKGLEFDTDFIQQNLNNGMEVSKLSLSWRESVSFVLGADFTVKRIKFGDLVQEKLDDIEADDKASKFDAGFSIMSLEFDQMIPDLLEALGGEDKSALISD
jgi:recombination associated protein RdgC